MKMAETKDFLLEECEKKIKKRLGKLNHIDECLAIEAQYRLLNSEPGSPVSNKSLAEQLGISRRAVLYKRYIGKKINKKLRRIILQNPAVNQYKFLYFLSKINHLYQEVLLSKVLAYIQVGVSLKNAMKAVGLVKKEKDGIMDIPHGKVPVFIQKEVLEKAKILEAQGCLSIPQRIEHYLVMESAKKEREQTQQKKQFTWRF